MSELADLWYDPPSVQERIAMQGEISALRARVAQLEGIVRDARPFVSHHTDGDLRARPIVARIDAAIREAKP